MIQVFVSSTWRQWCMDGWQADETHAGVVAGGGLGLRSAFTRDSEVRIIQCVGEHIITIQPSYLGRTERGQGVHGARLTLSFSNRSARGP